MKKVWLMVLIVGLVSFAGCSIFKSSVLSPSPTSGPAMSVTPGPLAEASAMPAGPPVNSGPVSLEGSGGGTIEIEPIPGPYGETFNAAYMTWYINERDRFQEFRPAGRLTFRNVAAGEYLLNFRWQTNRWVVETEPVVEAEHRELNGRLRVRLNGGPWHELTSADTIKTGQYWNLRLVVP